MAGLKSLDIGGGSAPLQYFMAEHGHVTNIDINFLSSWFYTDTQVPPRPHPDRRHPSPSSVCFLRSLSSSCFNPSPALICCDLYSVLNQVCGSFC